MTAPAPAPASAAMAGLSLEAPDSSNVILFHMMNFYKRRAEALEEENNRLNKKLKQQYEDHRNEMGDLQQQLHDQVQINHHFAQVNLRGAELVTRKHQAAMRLAHCVDEIFNSIELVQDTVGAQPDALGIQYLVMKKNEVQQRADVAIQLLVRTPEMDESELTAWENEIAPVLIDLTNDTEDDGEETETDLGEDGEETEEEEM